MANKSQLTLGAVVLAVIGAYFGLNPSQPEQNSSATAINETTTLTRTPASGDSQSSGEIAPAKDDLKKIAAAYQHQRGDLQVQSQGRVIAVLQDDNEGSRHQKFLLELGNGQTVMVAHNIDLAPRIPNIQKGDVVEFYGEYEYNAKGGVIHWTHHDPQNRHPSGWLKHKGQIYQ